MVIISIIMFAGFSYFRTELVFYLSGLLLFIPLLLFLFIKKNRDDIAARQKIEKSLLDSNQQLREQVREKSAALRDIFERVSDAFVAVDTEWRYTYLNKKAEELLRPHDKPQGYLIGKYIFTEIPEAESSVFHKLANEAMITQEYRYVEDYDPRYDRWLANHIYPSPGGLSIFFRDITAKKKAEETLRISEEKYRVLIEQASDAIIITDQYGNFLDVNTSFCKLFGYTREELSGLNVTRLFDPVHLEANPMQFDLLRAGQHVSVERTAIHKNGITVELEINSKMLTDGRILAIARDITGRKKAEEALRRSEREYISLVNTVDGIVWEADAQTFRFKFVSDKAERLLGYPTRQWIDEPDFWSTHILKEDRKYAIDYCVSSTAAKEPHTFEYRMIAADGRIVWLQDIVSVIVENDAPVKLRGIMIDITEQKGIELKMREAEEKFRNLVEKSLVGVYIIQDGRFAYVNPKLTEIYGYTQEEITGQPLSLLADEDEMRKVNENIRLRLADETDSVHYEITGRKKDGSSIQVEVYGSKTRYKGRPAIIGTLIDISERKKTAEELRLSEQKYKLIFENSPLPMFMYTTPDYSIIDVNDAAVRHYGYTKEEFLHMNIKDLRPPEDIPRFLERAITAAKGSLGIWRHKKKDGAIIHVEIIAHDITYQDKPARLALANDMTEKLAAEERLQQSYKEIRMLASHIEQVREEEKIKIAREIHDELGQQITSLKMDVSWLSKKPELKSGPIAGKVKEIMDMLDETVKTVRRIATELRPGILDHLGLVAAMQWQSQEFEKRTGIKTVFHCDQEDISLPANLSTGFFRIFQESLTNVTRHAQASEVSAYLGTANGEITLKVSDNGKGFDVSAIGHKRTLGLLGMKERAMMMGGKYDLISEPGKGTTVIISVKLPGHR